MSLAIVLASSLPPHLPTYLYRWPLPSSTLPPTTPTRSFRLAYARLGSLLTTEYIRVQPPYTMIPNASSSEDIVSLSSKLPVQAQRYDRCTAAKYNGRLAIRSRWIAGTILSARTWGNLSRRKICHDGPSARRSLLSGLSPRRPCASCSLRARGALHLDARP